MKFKINPIISKKKQIRKIIKNIILLIGFQNWNYLR